MTPKLKIFEPGVDNRYHTAYLLTGSNLGNRRENLQHVRQLIDRSCGSITGASPVYETAPWGKTDQPPFLNQALKLRTRLSAPLLLEELLATEREMGRTRGEKYGARIVDIDILLYNQLVIHTDALTVPHPELQNRRFALTPLCDIAPRVVHPLLRKTIHTLLKECPDTLPVAPER